MLCSKCNKENPEGNKFCNFCGAPILNTLPPKKKTEDSFEFKFSVNFLKNAGIIGVIIALIIIMNYLFKDWKWMIPISIFIAGCVLITIAELILKQKKINWWGVSFEVAGFLVIYVSFTSALVLDLIPKPFFYILASALTLIVFLISFKSIERDSFYSLGVTAAVLIFLHLVFDEYISQTVSMILIIVVYAVTALVRYFLKKEKDLDYFSAIFPFVAITTIGISLKYNPDLMLFSLGLFPMVFFSELLKENGLKYSTYYFVFSFIGYFLTTIIFDPDPAFVFGYVIIFTFQVMFCLKPYFQVWRTVLFFFMTSVMVVAGAKVLTHLSLDILNIIYLIFFTVLGILSIKKLGSSEGERFGFKIYFRFLVLAFYFLMLFHISDWEDERCSILLVLIPLCYFITVYIFDWWIDSIFASILLFIGSIAVFSFFSIEDEYWIGNLVITLGFIGLSLFYKNRQYLNTVLIYVGSIFMLLTIFDKFEGKLGTTLTAIPIALLLFGFGIYYKKAFLRISSIVLILFIFGKGIIYDTNVFDSSLQIGIGIFFVAASMIGISYLYLKYPSIILGDSSDDEESELPPENTEKEGE
ncbi:MAG: zinc-ribbon domain-containing protein [bacterium]|nr:zinc-ribbon domain-containing protein [bacterium]